MFDAAISKAADDDAKAAALSAKSAAKAARLAVGEALLERGGGGEKGKRGKKRPAGGLWTKRSVELYASAALMF